MGAAHRDIKPENVLMRGGEAVLIDFDASRIIKNKSENDTRILGTTGYAAPEQHGISQPDERADIYALDVLLNIMLTGKHPSKELAAGRMGRIVQKCTMTTPKKRYKNVRYLMKSKALFPRGQTAILTLGSAALRGFAAQAPAAGFRRKSAKNSKTHHWQNFA